MAEETKEEVKEEETTLSFKTADELTKFLLDLQGQMANMQQTIDKLAPVEEETLVPEGEQKKPEEEVTPEEISEIDKLLQEG